MDPTRDADDVVALIRATSPLTVTSVEEWRHHQAAIPARSQLLYLAAEIDGRVVADAAASFGLFAGEGTGFAKVRVLPQYSNRGIGSALWPPVRDHVLELGPEEVIAVVDESLEGGAFADAHGFTANRAEVWSVLETRIVTDRPPPDIELRPAREIDPRELHRVDEEATRDMPLHAGIEEIPYDDWVRLVWEHPLFTKDGSFGAFVGGELAAISLLTADPVGRRALNMFTGTLARFRGRGLARAVKLASTAWAAANGIDEIVTHNDETNAAMLAINRSMGYRPAVRVVEYLAKRERLLRERDEHL